VAQLPDGRIFGFYDGGLNGAGSINGGIYQVVPNGSGGYSTTLAFAFSEGHGGPPRTSISGAAKTVDVGPDGKIYFAGRTLSRYDANANTVEIVHTFTDGAPTALTLGIDGHTLFGSHFDGRIYSYDTSTGAYRDVANSGNGIIALVQMKDGNLLAVRKLQFTSNTTLHRIDPATGAENAALIDEQNSYGVVPTKGDDGEVYVIAGQSGHYRLERIDTGCFCPHGMTGLPADSCLPHRPRGARPPLGPCSHHPTDHS
jgi:hypothetical protein